MNKYIYIYSILIISLLTISNTISTNINNNNNNLINILTNSKKNNIEKNDSSIPEAKDVCDTWRCSEVAMPNDNTCVYPVKKDDSDFYFYHVKICSNTEHECRIDPNPEDSNIIDNQYSLEYLQNNSVKVNNNTPYKWTCKERLVNKILPGEKCKDNSDCMSDDCKDNKCVGKIEKDKCENTNECSVGLYCNVSDNTNKQCEQLLQEDEEEKQCTKDNECDMHLGCNVTTDKDKKNKCVKYFSLNNGEKTKNNKLCISNYTYEGKCWDNELKEKSYLCADDQTECKYLISGLDKEITKDCECALVDCKSKFCPLDSKNDRSANVIKTNKDLLEENKYKHTQARFATRSRDQRSSLLDNQYPKFKQVDDCVNWLYTQNSKYVKVSIAFVMILVYLLF